MKCPVKRIIILRQGGDEALRTLSNCFWKAAQRKHRVYRIGGDEFVVLCVNSSEADVKALIDRIRTEVGKTQFYITSGKDRRKR